MVTDLKILKMINNLIAWRQRSKAREVCGVWICNSKPIIQCPRCGLWHCAEHEKHHFCETDDQRGI